MNPNKKTEQKKNGGRPNRDRVALVLDKKTLRSAALLVAFAIVLYWGLNHTEKPIALLGNIISAVSPFIIGLCIAFVINVLLRLLEKLWIFIWHKCKKQKWPQRLKRPICLTLSTLIVIGAIFAVVFMIIPEFYHTVEDFIANIPQYITRVEGLWGQVIVFAEDFGIVLPELELDSEMLINSLTSVVKNNDSIIVNKTIEITTSIFSVVANIIIATAFSIYVLAQKEKLGRQGRKLLYAFMRPRSADKLLDLLSLTNQTFSSFVTGQLTEAVIIGVLCFMGMLIFRMPYAAVISLLVGVTALIPVFGALIGTAIGAFLILLVSPIKAIWFVIFIIVLQQLEGNLIYPRVVGKLVGLPGIWVLAAVTLGNNLAGVVGMLLSVPLCAVLYCVLRDVVNARLAKKKLAPTLEVSEPTEENEEI